MMVIKKFVSILLAASLCIGCFFSVQGDTAFSASAYYDSLSFEAIDNVISWVNQLKADNPSYDVSVALSALDSFDPDGDNIYCLSVSRSNPNHWVMNIWVAPWNLNYWYAQGGLFSYLQSQGNSSRLSVIQFGYDGSWHTTNGIVNSGSYDISSPSYFSAISYYAPNTGALNSDQYDFYCSHDIYNMSHVLVYPLNLIQSLTPVPPVTQSFDLIRFQLGSRTYLTFSDQAMIRSINPDTEGYLFYLGFMFHEEDTLLNVKYSDLQVINGAQYMISEQLENISPIGVYCYDITNLVYDSFFYAKVLGDWYGEAHIFYEASNLPLDSPSGPGDVVQPYDEAWEQIINYYNTYNTTHVVPQNLGDTLFGLTGSQTAACWVSLPDDLVVTGTTSPLLDTIQWGFNDLVPSIDFSLMDVLVFPAGAAEALVEYYYNKSFTPSMVAIDRFSFANLLSLYDVIIIVDSEYTVGSLNPFVVSETGGILHHAFTGLSQGGMDYIDSAVSPWPEDQTYHGFCFITKKAIQKQQLYNFNDGITKSYDLMVQYIDKRDSWDDSFLLWSSSVFDMLNSLDGRLSKIEWFLTGDFKLSDYLNNILDKLDNLVNNTSVDEVSPDSWYASLWRFVKRFDVQDSTFANWLDDLDDFYEELPDLPEVQPTIIPFPTYIPAPTEAAG